MFDSSKIKKRQDWFNSLSRNSSKNQKQKKASSKIETRILTLKSLALLIVWSDFLACQEIFILRTWELNHTKSGLGTLHSTVQFICTQKLDLHAIQLRGSMTSFGCHATTCTQGVIWVVCVYYKAISQPAHQYYTTAGRYAMQEPPGAGYGVHWLLLPRTRESLGSPGCSAG